MLIRLLGDVSAGEDADTLQPPRGRIATSVLAVLALARGRLVTTESLIDDLWGDPPNTARNAIQVAVSALRKQFGATLIEGSRVGYRLRVDLVRIDWLEAEQRLAAARERLDAGDPATAETEMGVASSLFSGEEIAGADAESVRASRGAAVQLRRSVVTLHARALTELGRGTEALGVVLEEILRSPLDEQLHVLAMAMLREQGRSAEGLELFESLRHRLDDELGAYPASETVDEFHRLLDAGVPVGTLRQPVVPKPVVSLPALGVPLLGRARELAELVDLIQDGHGLLTLLGPGGIGKTSLVTALAYSVAHDEARPAIFVDLTLCRTPAEIRRLVADLLATDPESVVNALDSQRMIIVLDNAEHVAEDLAEFVVELQSISDLLVLVTSRIPLGLSQERRFDVDGLASDRIGSPGTRLLTDRAGFSPAEIAAGETELRQLATRCDGIPLALELLGSALRWRPISDLLAAVDVELPSITDGSAVRAPRHASVRAAIEWSIENAEPDARLALAVLSTVLGTFELSTAHELMRRIGIADPRQSLAQLVDASLIKRERTPGSVTFRVLAPIRIVAQLIETSGRDKYLAAHAEVFLQMLDRGHAAAADTLKEFDEMIVSQGPNLSLALSTRWRADPEHTVEAVAQLMYGWHRRDRSADLRTWAARVLDTQVGTELDRARVRVALLANLAGLTAWDRDDSSHEFERLRSEISPLASQLDGQWHRRWIISNFNHDVTSGLLDSAEHWIAQLRFDGRVARFWAYMAQAILSRERGDWAAAVKAGESAQGELDPATREGEGLQARSELAFDRVLSGDVERGAAELREIIAYTAAHGMGFEHMTAQVDLAFVTSLHGRPRDCLELVLSGMDWDGGNVWSSEVALYAAMALNRAGDVATAHTLATLVATTFVGTPAGSPRLVDQPYLRPHWERLLAELPPLDTDSADVWEAARAREVVADALARLPADS